MLSMFFTSQAKRQGISPTGSPAQLGGVLARWSRKNFASLMAVLFVWAPSASLAGQTQDQQDALYGLDDNPPAWSAPAPTVVGLRPGDTLSLSGNELLRQGYRSLGEALADITGVRRKLSTQAPSYGMRGIPGGVLLVIDGIPQLIDGERDMLDVDQGLNLDDVDRVEVIRGPVTAMNGVAALAGVVRVTTRRPGLNGARLRLGQTHLGEKELSAAADLRHGGLAFRASFLRRQGPSALWRLKNVPTRFIQVGHALVPSSKENIEIIPDDDDSTIARLSLAANALQLDLKLAHSVVHTPVSSYSHALLDSGSQQVRRRDQQDLELRWHHFWGPVQFELSAYGRHSPLFSSIALYPARGLVPGGGRIILDGDSADLGGLLNLRLPIMAHHQLQLSLFADLGRQWTVVSADDQVGDQLYPQLLRYDDLNASSTAAIEYQGDFGAGWHLSLGSALAWRTAYGLAFTPRLALSYQLRPWAALRAAYAEGSWAPDRYNLLQLSQAVIAGRAIGAAANPNLRPEHSRSLELSLHLLPSARLHANLAIFVTRHEDAVQYAVVNARMMPVNQAPRLLLGGEAELEVQAVERLLFVRAGLDLNRLIDGPVLDQRWLSLTSGAEITPLPGLALGVRGRASWLDSSDFSQGGAGLVEAYAAYALWGEHLQLRLVARNAVDGDEPSPDRAVLSGTSELALPTPGRVIFFSVEGRL